MFDLENKITWKELAPSLQSMFKVLQQQITDNKNDITNINQDLTEINNHLTNIDNSIEQINNNITNINKDISNIKNEITEINQNIENTYNELKEYVDNTKIEIIKEAGELDFLNLAPKIGYYQDDTIEVISKYNMNNPQTYGQTTNPIVTVDKFGRNIIYFLANDGSYDTNGKYQLYYGYNEGTAVMTFVNEPLKIDGAPNNLVTGLLSCDNDWIVIQYNSKWYIYDTNYSVDPKDWTNKKDITSIITSTASIGFKYIRKYGTIVIVYRTTDSLTADNWAVLKVYRYSDLALLHQYDLENFSKYCICTGDNYFDIDLKNQRLSLSGNVTTGYSCWHFSSFIINDDQEMITIVNRGLTLNYYTSDGVRHESSNLFYHISYNVPRSIFMGNTGTIAVQTGDHNVFTIGPELSLMDNYSNQSHYVVSYNSLSNISYACCNRRDGFTFAYSIIDNTIQRDGPTSEYLGVYNTSFINSNICWPADASLWGKWLKWSYNMWDVFNMYAVSKSGTNLISIHQFRKYNGHSDIIEPVPGYYSQTNIPYDANVIRPFWCATNGNPRGFTSCKMSDGSAEYWSTKLPNASGGRLMVYKWVRTSDQTLINEPLTLSTEYNQVKDFDIGTISYWNNILFGGKSQNCTFAQIYYNPIGDYVILFCRDTHNYFNDSNPSNPDYGNKLYMGIVKRDGTKIGWGYTNNSKYGDMGNYLETQSEKLYANKQNITYRAQTACCPSKNELIFVLDYYIRDGDYTNQQYKITFNDSLTDFSVKTIANISYSYKTNINESPSIYYSGPKYGFMVCGNGWVKYPQKWFTQYPIIDGEGTRYSDDDFITDYRNNSNQYSMYLQSSQGLIAYIPNIPIFLGGYFSVIENPIEVVLQPNCENYVYLERDTEDRDNIKATATTVKTIDEGDRVFSKILLCKITTNDSNMTAVEYYRINIGYNDYTFQNGGGG